MFAAHFRRFFLLLTVFGFGLTLSVMGRADNLPLKLMPSKSFSDVQAEAAYESVNGPVYSNSPDPATLPFHTTLTGTVTADGTMNKLAIFSDDGSDVYLDGVLVWNAKDKPQALPDLPNSLHEIPGTLSVGSHTVRIDYSNVIYGPPDPTTGQPVDIDGCTLFVYADLTASVTGGLTGGVIRACAGAIANPVHEDVVTINAQRGGTNAVGEALVVSYDSSVDYTGCQPPQLIDDQNQNKPVSTLTRTTDANGNITVTVLSSNLISQPNLIITYKGNQVGSAGCDFDTDKSLRRYGILTYDPGEGYGTDKGWDFDSDSLEVPGDTTDAIVFLKFQKDPIIPIDQNYYLSSLVGNIPIPSLDINSDGEVSDDEYNAGTIRGTSANPLNDASNWLAVTGHTVHLRISQITDYYTGVTITDPAIIQRYVYYVDDTGQPIIDSSTNAMPAFVTVTTGADGLATMHLEAGSQIEALGDITLDVVDETQIAIDGTGSF